MFVISKTGSLLHIANGQGTIIYNKADSIINTSTGCLALVDGQVVNHKKKIICQATDLYRAGQQIVAQNGSAITLLKPTKHIGNYPGKLAYYSDLVTIVKLADRHVAIIGSQSTDLFCSSKIIVFVDRRTPMSDTECFINIHTVEFTGDKVVQEIFSFNNQDFQVARVYHDDRDVPQDELLGSYVHHRHATYLVMKSGVVHQVTSSTISSGYFNEPRMTDRYLFCYNNGPEIYDMGDGLAKKY